MYPPLTLCSGRPAQFVDAVGQAIGLFVPAICENGAVLYDPQSGEHERLFAEADRSVLRAVRAYIEEVYAAPGWVKVAQGKEICVSVIPRGERWSDIRELYDELHERLDRRLGSALDRLTITYSAGAVDITPAGIDKASGVRTLLERLGIPAEAVLAIGDGGNDLPMLRRCGLAAAPANARPEVREAVAYVAPQPEAKGVLDILARFTGFRPSSGG